MARLLAEVGRRTPQQMARSKWQGSALTDAQARKIGLRALSSSQTKALNARFHEAASLHIPYYDLQGRRTKFFRIRYLGKLPGAAGLVEKPQRYDQLPVLQEAYYPPLMGWSEAARDPGVSLCITEGELKAACACAHGIPMMALGGVYSYMSGKRNIDLLPSMKEIVWKGRHVYIVYDNDSAQNANIVIAQNRLSQRLLQEGAVLSIISIPPGKAKGVDDYILAHGVDAFGKLIRSAAPYLEAEALWRMNSEVVLIKNDGVPIVVERATGTAMAPQAFTQTLYANRHFMKAIEKGGGKNKHVVFEVARTAPAWLEWEHRTELDALTYEPGREKVIADRAWNTWDGWGVAPKRGDVGPWHSLLDFLFDRADKERKYFEQWCAYPIQHPGAKLYTACVLWSRVKRLGKSMVGIALSYIYGKNAIFVNSRQLKSQFNQWAKDRQLVIGEEITANEARVDADYMKDLITSKVFTINSKFKAEYVIPNHTNFLHFSNHPDAFFLEDGDKRYMIHGIHHERPEHRAFYEKIDKWLHGEGPSYLMRYLLDLPMRGFNPREHAPETTSKYEMILAGKTDSSLWVQRLQEDPVTALKPLGDAAAQGCDLFTPQQLYYAFDPADRARAGRGGITSLGRHLASAGFRQVNGAIPVMTDTGIHRLYAVRNVVRWEQSTRSEIREHYNNFWGPQVAGSLK